MNWSSSTSSGAFKGSQKSEIPSSKKPHILSRRLIMRRMENNRGALAQSFWPFNSSILAMLSISESDLWRHGVGKYTFEAGRSVWGGASTRGFFSFLED